MENTNAQEVLSVILSTFSDPDSQRIIQKTLGDSLLELAKVEADLSELKEIVYEAINALEPLCKQTPANRQFVMSFDANQQVNKAMNILSN